MEAYLPLHVLKLCSTVIGRYHFFIEEATPNSLQPTYSLIGRFREFHTFWQVEQSSHEEHFIEQRKSYHFTDRIRSNFKLEIPNFHDLSTKSLREGQGHFVIIPSNFRRNRFQLFSSNNALQLRYCGLLESWTQVG